MEVSLCRILTFEKASVGWCIKPYSFGCFAFSIGFDAEHHCEIKLIFVETCKCVFRLLCSICTACISAKMGSQVLVPFRGSEDSHRHLKLMGDLGQVK